MHRSAYPPDKLPDVLNRVLALSLVCFILAGLTGFLFRLGPAYGYTAGFALDNIRHAHSHLMYFGWTTPLLMGFIGVRVPGLAGRPASRSLNLILAVLFGTALLSYPLFLQFGYAPLIMGARRIPLSVISAGVNILVWYAFVAYYIRVTRGVVRQGAVVIWDLAMVFLVLSTLGAWGLALSGPLRIHNVGVTVGLTHVFLDLFSEGWMVVGTLGVIRSMVRPDAPLEPEWMLIGLGIPTTFVLGMPSSTITPILGVMGRVGSAAVGVGLFLQAVRLLIVPGVFVPFRWSLPISLLALKAMGQIGAAVAPGFYPADMPGLRLLYLHTMLLGFVSLGLLSAASEVSAGPSRKGSLLLFQGAVLAVLFSLALSSGAAPAAWMGRWVPVLQAWLALGPVAAALCLLPCMRQGRSRKIVH